LFVYPTNKKDKDARTKSKLSELLGILVKNTLRITPTRLFHLRFLVDETENPRRGQRPDEHERRCHHSMGRRIKTTKEPCSMIKFNGAAFNQVWRITYRRSSQSSKRAQGAQFDVKSLLQLPVHGSLELTIYEGRSM
jgi:hypothetical protein